MFKNIIIFSAIFFFWFGNMFAAWNQTDSVENIPSLTTSSYDWNSKDSVQYIDSNWNLKASDWVNSKDTKSNNSDSSNSSNQNSTSSFNCEWWKDSLCSTNFKIDTNKFSPGGKWLNKTGSSGSKKTIDNFLSTTITKLMVALGSIALLIMVIWAWFMILWVWKDENVTKWKTILKSWIIALVVALSSYMLVAFVRFILYATN